MNKETYERTKLELLEFECEDVLTDSNPDVTAQPPPLYQSTVKREIIG